jgi:hypothetical protein
MRRCLYDIVIVYRNDTRHNKFNDVHWHLRHIPTKETLITDEIGRLKAYLKENPESGKRSVSAM